MSGGALRLAAAQSVSRPGDLAANVQSHLGFLQAARQADVDLLVFPELSLSGYEPALLGRCVIDAHSAVLAPLQAAASAARMTVVVGAPVASGDEARPHIGAIVLFPDAAPRVCLKHHLHPGEEAFATPGPAGSFTFSVGGVACALAICADFCHPTHAQAAHAAGAQVYVASALISTQGHGHDAGLLQDRAFRHSMAVLLSNHGGPSGGYVSAGCSAFWAPDAQQVAQAEGTGPQLLVVEGQGARWSGQAIPV